jgi:hypothetical protein
MLKIIGLLVLVLLVFPLLRVLRKGARAGQQLSIIHRHHSRALLNRKPGKENSL